MPRITLKTRKQDFQFFPELIAEGIALEMMLIPAGEFMMGSPDSEKRTSNERPQHQVKVAQFFMAKTPVTQAQWSIVATTLRPIEQELDSNPARFKGDNRPVERVSWYEAMEFCERLTAHTSRTYMLPTEAQWEYACRGGTDTSFSLGETITSEVANYNANYTYGSGVKGEYRVETTPVDYFAVANPFGLWDMHGNVWEWCLDHWHDGYEGAPKDESVWLSPTEDANRVLRGGSWDLGPRLCRSAARDFDHPGTRDYNYGFRVVCLPQDFS